MIKTLIVSGGNINNDFFKNQILTSGQYETVSPAFEKALITVFRKEGGCGTIKNDPCGYTCYGIGSSSKCSGVVVHSASEAEDFYYGVCQTDMPVTLLLSTDSERR